MSLSKFRTSGRIADNRCLDVNGCHDIFLAERPLSSSLTRDDLMTRNTMFGWTVYFSNWFGSNLYDVPFFAAAEDGLKDVEGVAHLADARVGQPEVDEPPDVGFKGDDEFLGGGRIAPCDTVSRPCQSA